MVARFTSNVVANFLWDYPESSEMSSWILCRDPYYLLNNSSSAEPFLDFSEGIYILPWRRILSRKIELFIIGECSAQRSSIIVAFRLYSALDFTNYFKVMPVYCMPLTYSNVNNNLALRLLAMWLKIQIEICPDFDGTSYSSRCSILLKNQVSRYFLF